MSDLFLLKRKKFFTIYLEPEWMKMASLKTTPELRIFRRYIAACLLEKNILQFPPMPENTSNKEGEDCIRT